MSAVTDNDNDLSSIELEVLRARLQAMAEEGATTIERTACSSWRHN